jgi:hypothetical protein
MEYEARDETTRPFAGVSLRMRGAGRLIDKLSVRIPRIRAYYVAKSQVIR